MLKAIEFMYYLESKIRMIAEFGQSPHIVVSVKPMMSNVPSNRQPLYVPQSYVKEGSITLNLNPGSIDCFHVDVEEGYFSFSAKFKGVAHSIVIPIEHIVYIHNAMNGASQLIYAQPIDDWNKLSIVHNALAKVKPLEPEKKPNPFSVVKT